MRMIAATQLVYPLAYPEATDPRRRIEVLDMIRGAMVMGLLLANMAFYSSSGFPPLHGWPHSVDGVLNMILMVVAQGKVYAVFSFLFGLGLVMQFTPLENNRSQFLTLYLRRMIILMCIGAVHACFIWYEDILLPYAVLGLLFIPLWGLSQRAILILAGILLFAPVMINGTRMLMRSPGAAAARTQPARQQNEAAVDPEKQAKETYSTGTFAAITLQRIHDFRDRVPGLLAAMPHMLALMLFGVYLGRRRLVHDLKKHSSAERRVFWWSLALGLGANALSVGLRMFVPRDGLPLGFLASMLLYYLGSPTLALAYGSGIVLLSYLVASRRYLRYLAPVGRMTLTNYLLQSLICSILFYGYGFGLYGKLGAVAGLALSLVIFTAELSLSHLWLRYFTFGPIEWLWRFSTYGRRHFQEQRSMTAS